MCDPVRPSQARKTLLSRLDYDTEVAGKDVMSNFQNGPTLTKDEQERCRCAITSPKLTHWIESKRSSLLVINGNGTGPRKSGLSFLCARLVYSLDRMRGDETDPKTIVRPEIVPIHFFCGQHLHNDRSKTWESPRGVVNSLLAQLIAQCKNIDVSKLKEARYTKLDKSKSKVKEVLQIFRLLIKQLPPHFAVFCVIDGLSFYANNDDISKATRLLVNGLLELFETSQEESKSHPVFKLLLTAPTTLRLDVVDDLNKKQVLKIPKRQPDKGGLNAIQWERELEKHLKEV